MQPIQYRQIVLWFFLATFLLSSCSPKSTPPGDNSMVGKIEEAVYSYHYWEEGLGVLIWHDYSYGGETCSGTGSTEDPVFRLECYVDALDGSGFNWEIHTRDGVAGLMWINGESYDLAQGTMFLLSSQDGEFKVVQLQRDLSGLVHDEESIAALALSDSDVAAFVESIDLP